MTRAEALEDMKADFDKRMLEARMARDWFSPNHPRYDYWDGVIDDLIAEKNELTEPERQAEEIRADAEWLDIRTPEQVDMDDFAAEVEETRKSDYPR